MSSAQHTSAPVVLVTGASRGIGAATALAFGRAGWRVAIVARTHAEHQAMAHQLRRPDGQLLAGTLATTAAAVQACGAEVFAHPMDLMSTESMDSALDAVLEHFGRIDLLINNAVYQDREVNAMLLSDVGRRDWPLRFYSRELLFSVAARRRFVEPDLAPLPA